MIPIRDDNPHFITPVVTIALIVINVFVWLSYQGFGADPRLSASICQLGFIPVELFGGTVSGPVACPPQPGPGWPMMVSSMFMHGGWMHIAGNMWFLWIFGNNVEDSMGHFRFAVFYIICGLAAAALQALANPASGIPMVGASGAIGGVMGAYLVLYPRVHVHLFFYFTTIAVPAMLMLGYWLAIQLLGGFGSSSSGGGTAFWAHVGGFIAGAALIFVFKDKKLLERHPYYGWRKQQLPTQNWQSTRQRRF